MTELHPAAQDALSIVWPALPPDSITGPSTALMDSIAQSVEFDPVGHLDGVAPYLLPRDGGADSWMLALILFFLFVAAFQPAGLRRALNYFRGELWNVRGRRNAFDENSGGVASHGARPMRLLLIAGAVVVCGICASIASGAPGLLSLAAGIILAAAYYIFGICSYSLVGYAFTTPEARSRWMGGYNASVAMTGVSLLLPAMGLICFPEQRFWLLVVAAILFAGFKIVFIRKGIRIFYDGIASLLYFILYLCTLEVIPLFALWRLYGFLPQLPEFAAGL